MKTCKECKKKFIPSHPLVSFCSDGCRVEHRNKRYKDVRRKLKSQGLCRECYHRKIEKGKSKCLSCLQKDAERAHQKRIDRPSYVLFQNAKRRAEADDLPFTIQELDIVIPSKCPVFGIELSIGKYHIHDASPTLDKINPELGYVPNNIIVMSRKANRLKNNASLDELILLGEWAQFVKRNRTY